MRKRLLILFLALASVYSFAQPGTLDPTFNPDDKGFGIGDGITGTVRTTAVQPDGKVLVAGWFHAYDGTNRYRIARLKADGTLDTSFDPGYGASGTVSAMVLQPDGKILIGGVFSTYQGRLVPGIARINPDGSLDATFTSGLESSSSNVNSITVQSDGKIIIGGRFAKYNGTSLTNIARLNPDGSLDATFNGGTELYADIYATAVQPDGKILVGGAFTLFNGMPRSKLVRLNPDGSLDQAFNPQGSSVGGSYLSAVYSIATGSDGKIVIGGNFNYYNGATRNGIARLNPDGTLDPTFGSGSGASDVRTIKLQNDGKILIGGDFTTYNGSSCNRIARLNPNGDLDNGFDPGTGVDDLVYAVSIQSDNKLLISGDFLSVNGISRHQIARLNNNGTLDLSFYNVKNTGAQGPVYAVTVQPDGKALIGGAFFLYNDQPKSHLVRINPDGSVDETFNTSGIGPNDDVEAIAIQPDGKILIAGNFYKYNGTTRNRIARLNTDGSLDLTFNPGNGPAGGLRAMVLQPDGRILIGGVFFEYNNMARSNLARLNPNGSLDGTFNTTTGTNGYVATMVPQPDGKILIGGDFTTYKGITRNRIARINADGSLDVSFDPGSGADRKVETITLLNDGNILVGGEFAQFNGVVRGGIARIDAAGLPDPTFNTGSIGVSSGLLGTVRSTIVQPDGKILLGGLFSSYNGLIRNSIVRIDANGNIDSSFNSGKYAMGAIDAMALLPNNDILIGGDFISYNSIGRNRIARLFGGTFSIGTVDPTVYCQGSSINIPITTTGGYKAGNVFMAQLSNASGSFASPIMLGTLSSTTSGSLTGTIPFNTPAGTGYKIRVMIEEAGVVQIDHVTILTIKAAPATPLVTANTPTTFCLGRNVTLNSSATAGNQWYKDGVIIDNATEQSYTTNQSGSYTTIVTANGCSSPASAAKVIAVTPTPEKPTITRNGSTLMASTATSYQWYLNGEMLPEATLQSYAVQAAGTYTVQITQSGCTASVSADPYNFVSTALPTPAAWNGDVIAYPNPTIKTLYLRNTAHRKLAVQLVDASGSVFYTATITTTSASIDMSGFVSGVYRLVITDIRKQETIILSILKQ